MKGQKRKVGGDLLLKDLSHHVQETINYVLTRITRDQTVVPPIAGWHNYFKPGRIGTTGTAVPLIFLHDLKVNVPYQNEVINSLLKSQSEQGAWAILSMGDIPSVEGTAWPMRALALVGDESARKALYKAEEWLIAQQHEQGGWGSTKANTPRTLLTLTVVESLTFLCAPPREVIGKTLSWFSNNQRRDGSWGAEPGQDGTVYHTARVIKALLKIGLLPNDPRIQKAILFLNERWLPDGNDFLKEIYDVHSKGNYSRVILEHDVDAAVTEVILNVRPLWGFEKLLFAIEEMIRANTGESKLHPSGMETSIWNIIPRATAFAEFLNHSPLSGDGRVICYGKTFIYTSNPGFSKRKDLAKLLLKYVLISTFTFTSILLSFFFIVSAIIGYLYYIGSIAFKDVLLSIFVELAGLAIALYRDIKVKTND